MDQRFDQYSLIHVGNGTFGEVYKVVSSEDKETYSVKVIELKANHITFDSFLREFNVFRIIDHPNVIKLVDAFKVKQTDDVLEVGIQTEFCSLGDMEMMIKERKGKKFRSQSLHKWMVEISSAIAYMHAKEFLHRNLKLANVLLDKHSSIKVTDFKLTREVQQNTRTTTSNASLFMAPETNIGSYSEESDVYSMGCVFWCMATMTENPKTIHGDFYPLPPKITYGELKMDIVRRCVSNDKNSRPKAADVYRVLKMDDYEMLCFHEVRSQNLEFSVNKMVAGLIKGQSVRAFVFSNRTLEPEERFCLMIQKVPKVQTTLVRFGFTTTNPANHAQNVPSNFRELQKHSNLYVKEAKIVVNKERLFSFWFEENGDIVYQYNHTKERFADSVPLYCNLWAVFCIEEEFQQIQLSDYISS